MLTYTKDAILNLATSAEQAKGGLSQAVAWAFKEQQLEVLADACSAASDSQLGSIVSTISRVSKDITGQRWGWSKKTKTLQPTKGTGGRKEKSLTDKIQDLADDNGGFAIIIRTIESMLDAELEKAKKTIESIEQYRKAA